MVKSNEMHVHKPHTEVKVKCVYRNTYIARDIYNIYYSN